MVVKTVYQDLNFKFFTHYISCSLTKEKKKRNASLLELFYTKMMNFWNIMKRWWKDNCFLGLRRWNVSYSRDTTPVKKKKTHGSIIWWLWFFRIDLRLLNFILRQKEREFTEIFAEEGNYRTSRLKFFRIWDPKSARGYNKRNCVVLTWHESILYI